MTSKQLIFSFPLPTQTTPEKFYLEQLILAKKPFWFIFQLKPITVWYFTVTQKILYIEIKTAALDL
jgi:hypothetical protein